MPQKLIDQTTIQPDGRPGDDAFTAFATCNDNFEDSEQRLSALEGGSSNIGQDVADLKAGLQQEMQARSQGDQALQSAVNAADGKATDAGAAAAAAQATASAAMPKAGGAFSGPVDFRPAGENASLIRIIADGGGGTTLQAVNGAGTAFTKLSMRGQTVEVEATNQLLMNTTQLKVLGPVVPGGQYAGYVLATWNGRPGDNDDRVELQYYRDTNDSSSSWASFNWRFGRVVDASTQQFIEFSRVGRLLLNVNGQPFLFQSNGNATAPGSFINGGSDPAIKDAASLRPIVNATDALSGLNVCIGRYKVEFNSNQEERAFVMADDAMRAHTPEVIIEDVIAGQYAGWATDQLIAYLVAAHQERQAREVATAERLSALESRLAALETAMANATPANQPE